MLSSSLVAAAAAAALMSAVPVAGYPQRTYSVHFGSSSLYHCLDGFVLTILSKRHAHLGAFLRQRALRPHFIVG